MSDAPDYVTPIETLEGLTIIRTLQFPWWLRYTPKRILYIDDFNSTTLKYDAKIGVVVANTTNRVFEGDACLEMDTAAAIGNTAYWIRRLGYPGLSKMAIQLRWKPWCVSTEDLRAFFFRLEVYDGTYERGVDIGYQYYVNGVAEKKWKYWDGVGSYPDIPGAAEDMSITDASAFWNYLRCEFDFTTDKHVSLETNRLLIDMSTLPIFKGADTLTPQIRLFIGVATDVAAASKVLVDCLCLSDQEP